jgi:hypothetical protein
VLQHASLQAKSGNGSVLDCENRFHITERQRLSG